MKKLFIFTVATLITSTTFAEGTLSLGYSHGKIKDRGTLKGANIKYTHPLNEQWGIITSATFMKGEENDQASQSILTLKRKLDTRYFSLTAGPTYKINDYLNIYGTLGVGSTNTKATATATITTPDGRTASSSAQAEKRTTSFSYGIGTQINVTPNFLIDVGYEGNAAKQRLNSFVIGVGYKF